MRAKLAAAVLLLSLSGCVSNRYALVSSVPDLRVPHLVAVLPTVQPADIVMRRYTVTTPLRDALLERGYYLLPNRAVERLLKELGIETAEQLEAASPTELAKNLRADGLVYARLTASRTSQKSTGYGAAGAALVSHGCALELELVDAADRSLWKIAGRTKTRLVFAGPAAGTVTGAVLALTDKVASEGYDVDTNLAIGDAFLGITPLIPEWPGPAAAPRED